MKKKLLSVLLAGAMIASFSVPVFADELTTNESDTVISEEFADSEETEDVDFSIESDVTDDDEIQDDETEDDSIDMESEKEDLINEYLGTIVYIEDLGEGTVNMDLEEQKLEDCKDELENMSVSDIEDQIEEDIKEIAEDEDCYFSEQGVEYVEEYCPEIADDIQTEEDLKVDEPQQVSTTGSNVLLSKIKNIFGEEAYAASSKKTYKKSNTWAYHSLGVTLVKETLTIEWTVKDKKITKVVPYYKGQIMKNYVKLKSCGTTKNSIASNKKTATVEVKTVYILKQSKIVKTTTRHTGAKVTNTGSASFHQ